MAMAKQKVETRIIEEGDFRVSGGGMIFRVLEHTEHRTDGEGPLVTCDIEVVFGGAGVGTSYRIPIVANMPEYLEVVFGRLAKRFGEMRASGKFSSVNRDHYPSTTTNVRVTVANGHDLNATLDQFPECKLPTPPAGKAKITKASLKSAWERYEKSKVAAEAERFKKRFELLQGLFGAVGGIGGEYQLGLSSMRRIVATTLLGGEVLVKEVKGNLVQALTERPETLRVIMGGAQEKNKRQFIDLLGITDEGLIEKLLYMPE